MSDVEKLKKDLLNNLFMLAIFVWLMLYVFSKAEGITDPRSIAVVTSFTLASYHLAMAIVNIKKLLK